MGWQRIFQVLFDPRGRCSRAGLLYIALGLIAFELAAAACLWLTGIGFTGTAATVAKIAFLWVAAAATAKRLHDLDRSAWWIAGAIVAMFGCALVVGVVLAGVAGPAASDPNSPMVLIAACGVALPVFSAAVWLHFARGNPAENRFGPAPDASGFGFVQDGIGEIDKHWQTA